MGDENHFWRFYRTYTVKTHKSFSLVVLIGYHLSLVSCQAEGD